MPKPNARTFRYSDEVKLILEQHNNDFDALIVEAYLRLPDVKSKVEHYENLLSNLRNEYNELFADIYELKGLKRELGYIEDSLKRFNKQIENM